MFHDYNINMRIVRTRLVITSSSQELVTTTTTESKTMEFEINMTVKFLTELLWYNHIVNQDKDEVTEKMAEEIYDKCMEVLVIPIINEAGRCGDCDECMEGMICRDWSNML